MRPEIEKTMLAAGMGPPDDVKKLLSSILPKSSVLDLNGGVGLIAEYLSKNDCLVTLTDGNRLSLSYRKALVPNSTVKFWNIESQDIKLNKPSYDYVICRSTGDYSLAFKLAKKGVVLTYEERIVNVVDNESNTARDAKTN
jgi:hypothetical protein